jgi:hypothetical protein
MDGEKIGDLLPAKYFKSILRGGLSKLYAIQSQVLSPHLYVRQIADSVARYFRKLLNHMNTCVNIAFKIRNIPYNVRYHEA